MASGRKQLQRVQIGKQSVFGTLVPTTTIWRGKGSTPDDQRKIEEIDEMIGVFGEGADRTAVTQVVGALELSETPLSYEQAQYILAMMWGGPTTGAADGIGTDKIYQTSVPTTSGVTPVYYAVEGGDDFEVETAVDCVATKFSVSGKMGETNRMSATLAASEVAYAAAGFTAAIGIPVVEDSICQLGKVYLDAIGGTYGATQVATTIISHKLDVEAMWVPIYGMAGSLLPTAWRYAGHKITGELLYLHDTAAGGAAGAKKFFRDQTAKLLRVDLEGNAVATPGTAYSKKHFIYDLPIKFTKAAVLGDNDGISTVAMSYRSRYNVTAGNAGKVIVVNELTTLT
jgi:hypothetical protein